MFECADQNHHEIALHTWPITKGTDNANYRKWNLCMFKCAAALENSLAALLKQITVKNRINCFTIPLVEVYTQDSQNMSTVNFYWWLSSSSIIHSSLKGAIT